MPTAYLALGSNLANRRRFLAAALTALARYPQNRLISVSPVYETKPIGLTDQPDFLNCVVCLETDLAPHALLDICLLLEQQFGRVRHKRWGPRTIDLDLLLHGDTKLNDDRLAIPHPRMRERAFVLAPLADLAPDLLLHGETVRAHLDRLGSAGVLRTAINLFPPLA